MSFCHFEGAPCLRHNNYTFYKAFKYKWGDHFKILAIGDFFFLKILQEIPVCIGEIELLWEDQTSNQFLTSLRLYFRPEHTPDGRQDDTGEDEVVALGERLVLRLDDLIPLIQHDIKWMYGGLTYSSGGGRSGERNEDLKDDSEIVKKEWKSHDVTSEGEEGKNGIVMNDGLSKKRSLGPNYSAKVDNTIVKNALSGAANLAVMSYPKYCRYRAIQKRLEGCENEWLHLAVVMAIGGFSGKSPGCRVMFCRDTFYQAEIDDLDIRMDHLLPVLKVRTKAKKSRQLPRKDSQQDSDSMEDLFANVTPSISSSSRPRRLTETSDVNDVKVSTKEQTFLIGLHKYMHDSKMPIGRIPSLGFKQIDLYQFYLEAEKLGGYDSITHKRMWKHLYDKMGGNSSNTSAATCTRKHYERLLLPYERHLRKLKVGKVKKKHPKRLENEPNKKMNAAEIKALMVKDENVDVKPKSEVLEELVQQDAKENVRLASGDGSKKGPGETVDQSNKHDRQKQEHSKLDLLGESEVLEIPLPKPKVGWDVGFRPEDKVNMEERGKIQQLSLTQMELKQLQNSKSSVPLPSNAFLLEENPALPIANMVYEGGYLVPLLPPHLLQTSLLGIVGTSSSSSSTQIRADGAASQPNITFKDSTASLSTKVNRNAPIEEFLSKSSIKKMSFSSQPPSSSGSDVQKAAHTNTPYKSSPYLLNDHIQPARKVSHSFHHFSGSDNNSSSSQNLAHLLHPTPPGHRSQLHLPPAPSSIYLHPTSINPLPPPQSPHITTPSPAHNHPRKRIYPFDSHTASSTGVFPSPDVVLNRIRNSTGLPHSSAVPASPLNMRQQFEDPRLIFRQTPQTVSVNQNVPLLQHKELHSQQEVASSKSSHAKSKNSRKGHQAYSVYSHLPSPELQQALLQQGLVEHRPSNKVMDQSKPTSTLNGTLSTHQTSKLLSSVPPASPVPSSSKDVRLTSALFGKQFTALPRTTKPSKLPPQQSLLAEQSPSAVSTMSMNPHLHPAFMNPYLPSGGGAAPQFQMLASPFTTPAQLAAEILRQNDYGAFFTAAVQGKLSKKN